MLFGLFIYRVIDWFICTMGEIRNTSTTPQARVDMWGEGVSFGARPTLLCELQI